MRNGEEPMMEFLHPESKFMEMLNKITDMMILNVIFIITSIPMITLGASMTALYAVTLKLAEGEDVYIVRDYFDSFRKNFRKATFLWIILLITGLIIAAETALLIAVDFQLKNLLLMVQGGLLLFYLITFIITFPLVSVSDKGVVETLKAATGVPFQRFPEAMALIALHAVPVVLTWFVFMVVPQVVMLWGFVGFAYIAYLSSYMMNRIFLKME